MLGNAMLRVLSEQAGWQVYGTVRSGRVKSFFEPYIAHHLISAVDVEQPDSLMRVFTSISPDIVINCIGLVKQLSVAKDPLFSIPINSQLPHRLAQICKLVGARLIHISTDCVFSGSKGSYVESDYADAQDLYGRSKFLGEVDYRHAITLRTSIIGHELQSQYGLVEWFLSQGETCKGYTKAIFSGMPTVVLANIIKEAVIPNDKLNGVYHVAAKPIAKYDLLKLIAEIYEKKIKIISDDTLVIDRSLDAARFLKKTGYDMPEWKQMIELMKKYN